MSFRRRGLMGAVAGAAYAGGRWMGNRKTAPAVKKVDKRQDSELTRIKKRIRKIVPEQKNYDRDNGVSAVEVAYNNLPTANCLTGPAQGDTSLTREGLAIRGQYLTCNIFVRSDGGGDQQHIVFYLVQDKQGSGAVPTYNSATVTDVFESITEAGQNFLAVKNHENRHRYVIKDMKRVRLSDTEGKESSHFTLKCKIDTIIRFLGTGSGASPANTGKNNIWLMAISNIATASNPPVFSYYSRLKFTDN